MTTARDFLDVISVQVNELKDIWDNYRGVISFYDVTSLISNIETNMQTLFDNAHSLSSTELDELMRLRNRCSPTYEQFKQYYGREGQWGDLPPR